MSKPRRGLDSFWHQNSLSIVVGGVFLIAWIAQFFIGRIAWNDELVEHGLPALGFWAYATSGHFVSATFENWESEFLQMGMYVVLTVMLRQKGSAESRPMLESEEEERIDDGPVPWPVQVGGAWLWIYERSLSLAFFALFTMSFGLHLLGSWRHAVDEKRMLGEVPEALWEHASGAQFWFESMQNWQSEFLAVFSIVVLSIVLRQKDSPQSKPIHAPHSQTGD